jgi:hypothetical protein
MCVSQVPSMFPIMFLIAPHFYLILFALSSTLVTYKTSPRKDITLYIETLPSLINFFFVMSQSKMPIITKQKRINLWGFPQPINMYIITTTNIWLSLLREASLMVPQNIIKIKIKDQIWVHLLGIEWKQNR